MLDSSLTDALDPEGEGVQKIPVRVRPDGARVYQHRCRSYSQPQLTGQVLRRGAFNNPGSDVRVSHL